MTEVVTRLVIAADGSLNVLGQFERGMERAGQATEFTTGAVADYQRRMDTARAAMERGNALTTQTVQRKTAEQRAWERWSATVDKTTALRIRLEREAANASVAATNAVISGFATQEQALSTLSALEQRHNAQLAASIAMHNREASAIDNATASMRANTAAANSNVAARRTSGAHAGHTTNLLFQAQDIAMMTAMGQAPMMLAMQQGMQVAGVFHQIGNGRQILSAVGGAILGLLNPLNLATIAFIGLGSAGVQALLGMGDSADEATTALQRHKNWLDQLLPGYEAAREAAQRAVDAAMKLPQGVVQNTLERGLENSAADYSEQIETAARRQAELNLMIQQWIELRDEAARRFDFDEQAQGRYDALIEQARALAGLEVSARSTNAELANVMTVTDRLMHSASEPAIRNLATDLFNLAQRLLNARAEMGSTQAALAALQGQAFRGLGVGEAIDRIVNLTPELRSTKEIVNDIFEQEAGQARTTSELQALADAASNAIAALDEQERRAEALRSSRAGGKSFDQWRSANDNFQQRIAQQRMELGLLGQSTFEVERQRAAFDLLNQAKQAGVPITDQVTSQINVMATEYATLTDQMRQQQLMASTAISINNTLANGFADLWTGIITGSKSASEAIGGLLLQLGQMAINNAFMSLFGGGTAGGIGGALAGIFMPNALGNVYTSPGLSAYSGRIVDQPTIFPFARGIGLMGEAGPEAILPLSRGPDGRLGVAARNENRRSETVVQIIDQRRNAPPIEQQEGIGPNGERQVRLIVKDEVRQYHEHLDGVFRDGVLSVQGDPRRKHGHLG